MKTLLLLACTATVLIGCNGTTAPNTADFESLPADQVLYGVEHAISFQGVRRSNLKTDTTLIFEDSATVQLRGVNLEMYDENGQVRATLTSKTGELNRNTNKMVARGTVVLIVKGGQGRTVWTEELHYDPQSKRVWSDIETRSREPGGREVTGDGFSADDQFSNFSITRPRGGIRFSF